MADGASGLLMYDCDHEWSVDDVDNVDNHDGGGGRDDDDDDDL